MQDQELIHACQAGDTRALATLIDRWRRPLYGYLLRMTGQAADAEDLFQETWLRVWRTLPAYEERKVFSSYLFTVASRLCIDRARRRTSRLAHLEPENEHRPLEEAADGEAWPDRLLEDAQARQLLTEAVEALPAAQRDVVLLRLEAGLSFQEIAEIRGEPLGTALARMHRALKRIRRTFRQRGYDVPQ
jgi:RNA polymerase sigma-70 factor, ECF subfamily